MDYIPLKYISLIHLPITVTKNEQLFSLPDLSRTVYTTSVVLPAGKLLPGLKFTSVSSHLELSEAKGLVQLTSAEGSSGSAVTVMSSGQNIIGC